MNAMLFHLFSTIAETSLKGTVAIAVAALLILLLGRRLGARARCALWLIVLLRLALPATLPAPTSLLNLLPIRSPQAVMLDGVVAKARITAARSATPEVIRFEKPLVSPWWSAAAFAWLVGALLVASRALLASLRLQRSVRRAWRLGRTDGAVRAVVLEAAAELRVRRRIRVVVSDAVRSPALHGIVRPTLLLPSAMVTQFDSSELRHVVLHELWHLRRHDIAVNWLLVLFQSLHWFNPLVWFAAARVREEREICCDELALSCLEEDERHDYGTTMLKLLERFRTAPAIPALVGIVNPKQQMKRRLTMIAQFQKMKRVPLLFAGALAVVGFTAFTDAARGGEGPHRMMVRTMFDPAARGTIEKMHQKTSLSLTNASLGDLLSTVSAKSGVKITLDPALASNKVQQARFTLDATDIPTHLILMQALAPFGLMPKPDANGVTIVEGGDHLMFVRHGGEHEMAVGTGDGKAVVERRVIMVDGDKAHSEHLDIDEQPAPPKPGEERIMVRSQVNGDPTFDANGRLSRELTVKFDENGVESEGRLKIEIQTN